MIPIPPIDFGYLLWLASLQDWPHYPVYMRLSYLRACPIELTKPIPAWHPSSESPPISSRIEDHDLVMTGAGTTARPYILKLEHCGPEKSYRREREGQRAARRWREGK